jgi:hypothetical protein
MSEAVGKHKIVQVYKRYEDYFGGNVRIRLIGFLKVHERYLEGGSFELPVKHMDIAHEPTHELETRLLFEISFFRIGETQESTLLISELSELGLLESHKDFISVTSLVG